MPSNTTHRNSPFAKADGAGNRRPCAGMKLGGPDAIRNGLDSLGRDAATVLMMTRPLATGGYTPENGLI